MPEALSPQIAQMCLLCSEECGIPGEGEGPVGERHIMGGEPKEEVGECIPEDMLGTPGEGCVDGGIPGIEPPGPYP